MTSKSKITIVPLRMTEGAVDAPFHLAPDLSIESTRDLLKPENFDLWREHISPENANDLSTFSVGIVNRFLSPGHVGREEAESDKLVQETFVALRLIRPTRCRYSRIQATVTSDNGLDVFSFTARSEGLIQVSEVEAVNTLRMQDFMLLRPFLPKFRKIWTDGPSDIKRGIHYFESAYAQISDPVIQFITRMIGIEATLSSGGRPGSQTTLLRGVLDFVDANSNIYEDYPPASYMHIEPVFVGEVLGDIFALRNDLIHGGWFDRWKQGMTRPSVTGGSVQYPEILMAATSFILRKLLLKKIEEGFDVD